MVPHHRRRRSPKLPQLCLAASAALLLLSLSLLHSQLGLLSLNPFRNPNPNPNPNSLFDDATNDAFDGPPEDDLIDELDLLDDRSSPANDDDDSDDLGSGSLPESAIGLFWDHAVSSARRSFARSDSDFPDPQPVSATRVEFGSDDQPVDDWIRTRLASVSRVEDALMVEGSLREGWARWLDGKGDFLRRNRMLRSNLELLNPKNHPLLQDPDVPGVVSLTRGDRMVQRAIVKEMENVPFGEGKARVRVRVRRSLHLEKREEGSGRRWGYYPGIDSDVSFSEFVERFFKGGKCGVRVFLVWNSPSWMFGVRHQRGLESLLKHHKDACVLVLSETMELEFFEEFVKEGYDINVVLYILFIR